MPLHRITLNVSSCDSAYISDILFELGALSVTIVDQNQNTRLEQPIYGEPPQHGVLGIKSPPLWSNSIITSLFPQSYNVEILLMLIGTHFDLQETPTFRIHTDIFDEKSPEFWVRQVQLSFAPIVIGKVRIFFPWHQPVQHLLNVRLEPGMAFGTGEHPTTQLCVSWLQKVVKSSMSVLDFGTGSGVLAIVSTLLKVGVTAVGVDLDRLALEAAVSNARNNDVDDCATFFHNDEEIPSEYDVVVANILAGPLRSLAQTLVSRMKPRGFIGLSGILASQATELIEVYQRHGIILEEGIVRDGWALLVGVKS